MNLKFFRLYGLTIVVALFILYACLMPQTDIPDFEIGIDWPECVRGIIDYIKEHKDKVVHFAMFAVLAMAAARDFYRQRIDFQTKAMTLRAILFPIAYGGLVEILQELLTTTRSGDVYDFIADALGVIVGYVVAKSIVPKFTKREMLRMSK